MYWWALRRTERVTSMTDRPDEARRLATLRRYEVLDTPPDAALDAIARMASVLCATPIALISLVDENRQWSKSVVGDGPKELSLDVSFCVHAMHPPTMVIVPDATADPRFAGNPVVTCDNGVRFYAGTPLIEPDGDAIGTLAVIDMVPRELTPAQVDGLRVLADAVMANFNLRRQRIETARAESALRDMLTEHQRTEVSIRASEERYRLLFTQNPTPMWVFDVETLQFLAVNRAAVAHYGYTESEFLSMRLPDIRPPSDVPVLEEALQAVAAGERRVTHTHHRLKNGTLIDVDVTGDALVFDGRPARLVVVRDVTSQLASDRLRRESEERYALAVKGSSAGLWDWDIRTGHAFLSARYQELVGYQDGDLEPRFTTFVTLLHPDDRAAALAAVEAHLGPDRVPYDIDYRLRTRGGEYHWFNARGQALWDERGIAYRMAGSLVDIDERQRAAEALRESEERFRTLSRATNDAIWDWNLVSGAIWWNEGFRTLFGHEIPATGKETLQQWTKRIVESDRARVRARIERSMVSEDPSWSDEYRFVRADGSQAWVLDRGNVIRGEDGRVTRVVGGLTDVTARRLAEEQLAEQAALLNEAQDAIMLTDLEHRVLLWNSGAERLYGWSAPDAVGRVVHELHSLDRQTHGQVFRAMLQAGRWEGTLQHRTRDGRALTVESRWALTRDRLGQPRSILVFNTDVTERKRSEAQQLRAQRMESIGTLAGGIAHDLNNLLSPMMMSIELLRDACRDDSSAELLQTVQASAARGAALVQQVLSFARGVEGQRVPVSPLLLVREVQHIMRDSFPKSIRVTALHREDAWSVAGDPTQLHQVLLNLCVNARDAMPDGGELTIAVDNHVVDETMASLHHDARPGDYVSFRVSDKGTGIDPAVRDRIFEPFFSTKDVGQGTGLGLSTSLAIVRSHGGFISMYSEVGAGTTFRVYLPASRTESPSPTPVVAPPVIPGGSGELILVVDDEEAIRRVAQRTLERYGYQVITAANGMEALELYEERGNEIAVVFTDMAMPEMDGPELIAQLREMNPDIRIVGSSGLTSMEGLDASAGGPVRHWVSKPYTADAMLSVMRAVLS